MKCEVCFKCKEYIYIDEHYLGKVTLKEFYQDHKYHPRQVVEESELDVGYDNVSQKIIARLESRALITNIA